MASQFVSLIAQATPVGEGVRELVAYELRRLTQFDDPRSLWVMMGLALTLLMMVVVWFYHRERDALRGPLWWLLASLRVIAFAALALFFLGPEKRIDQQMVTDSQVFVLVDSSQSMSVEDESTTDRVKIARSEAVRHLLTETPLIRRLREQNDVVLAVFDEKLTRVSRWERIPTRPGGTGAGKTDAGKTDAGKTGAGETESDETAIEATDSEGTDRERSGNGETGNLDVGIGQTDRDEPRSTSGNGAAAVPVAAWIEQLQPHGGETQLGGALRAVLDRAGGIPLAGVIVLSDGGQNSGVDPLEIADRAAKQQSPLYTVGVGSTQPRRNLRVQELTAPSRVYPDDRATVSCLIKSEGFEGQSFDVELFAREAGNTAVSGVRIGNESITIREAGQVAALKFNFEPVQVGRLALEVRIAAPPDDQYAADNRREVEVEVVETESRVLLIASGASRDYRFLRNQLRRDRHMQVDVWLQQAQPGISQDADQLLGNFPETKEALYEYDCIVAFDPDWTMLDAVQVDLLESWVAEQAGGLVVIAGPIHTASWVQSPEHVKIRSLYPVEFQRRLTLLDDGLYGSLSPWPLEFTRDGEESDFLWLGDSASESRSLWSKFAGVFGCYAVKGPKPGARVLARYSDPEAGLSVERPVYLAEQFYGAGRVLYLGSSEIWRLRSLSIEYFEVLYTQLIRHVSQGRLLRGSSLGMLLVQRDRYTVGDDVVVRAQLSTLSREPLAADRVTARVLSPDGNGKNLVMLADKDRAGNFVGQFSVRQEGSYRIELPLPDVVDEQLVRRLQVVAPNLEFDETRRNERLLAALANRSGGRYYTSLAASFEGNRNLPPVSELIESRAETKTLRGAPDRDFTEWLNRILLSVICGALCLEWILRRLMRLA